MAFKRHIHPAEIPPEITATSDLNAASSSVSRERFENWYEASIKPLEISYCFRQDDDGYVFTPVVDAWEAWQAALSSLNAKDG